MYISDQHLLEEAYKQIHISSSVDALLEQYKEELLKEDLFPNITALTQSINTLASINITDIAAFLGRVGDLAKSVVAKGAISTVGVYAIGSILSILAKKRQGVDTLTKEQILSMAQANSKSQIEQLATQYEQGDENTKRQIIQQQSKILTDAVKRVEDQAKAEGKGSTTTNLMAGVGELLKQNSFILGLLLQVILGYFGILTYPSIIP